MPPKKKARSKSKNEKIKKLIDNLVKKGKEQGFLTQEDILYEFPNIENHLDILDEVFFGTQINFKPNLLDRPGNYRLIAWVNDLAHTKWNDQTLEREHGYGLGISFDQEITDELAAFLRFGWQDEDVTTDTTSFSLESAWSLGVQISGSLWGRDDDVVGIAFGQIDPSGDYKVANNLKAKTEDHLELYYSYKMNDNLTISPDLQVIWDPYGKDATNGDNTIIVGGMRAQVDF